MGVDFQKFNKNMLFMILDVYSSNLAVFASENSLQFSIEL
jgi:hypothetical protein